MSKLLFVNACIREESRTKLLADAVVKKWNGEVEEVDLTSGNIKPLDKETLKVRIAKQEAKDFSDPVFDLAKQFKEAEAVVIAAPFWDYSFPAVLKAYIENICVHDLTFEYNDKGDSKSLSKVKKVVYVTTVGGNKQELVYGIDYIKTVFREFFGVKKTFAFKAEGLDLVENAGREQEILDETLKRIDSFSFEDKIMSDDNRPDVIRTENLTKMYGNYAANNNVSCHVKEGSIYGLIGRNGAGKSTLMRLILGMSPVDQGTMEVFGAKNEDVAKVRKDIGFIIENPTFYEYMSAYQNLKYRAELIGLENPDAAIKEAMEKVGMADRMNSKVKGFSLGQRQLLGIANAILGNPKLLILDEPTNGLDPIKIVEIRKMLLDMNANGTTIMISSHILGEMDKLCSCYGFILDGKLIREVTEAEMQAEAIDVEEFFVDMAKGGQNA